MMAAGPSPWLICVELRADRTTPDAPNYAPASEAILPRLRSLLRHARDSAWFVAHVQWRDRDMRSGPIAQLEPLIDEPVFYLDAPSAFSIARLHERVTEQPGAALHFVGFAAYDVILPSLIAGRDLGLRVVLIEDAIASSASDAWREDHIVGLLKTQLTSIVLKTSADVMADRGAPVVDIRDFTHGGNRR
ncbi:MAG TPA: isochorismatase family protein [Caulobacterales bacterium]|nr:isochorismatase family protein [Caulobacterales bacterium]